MINYKLIILVFCLSALISFFLTPLMRLFAVRFRMFAKPGRRKVHKRLIPYLGGVAIYVAFIIGILVVFLIDQQFKAEFFDKMLGFIIAATFIVLLGLWDDIKNIKPVTKLGGQILVGLIMFGYGFRIEVLTNPFFGGEMQVPLFFSWLVTTMWFVGLMNAMNLIDGLDGLAGGIAVIVGISLTFAALYLNNYTTLFLLIILVGSVLGFLKYNFYPAKIFMGDSGSMFLGLILASAALVGSQYKSSAAIALLIPTAALAIPIYDTFVAIVRRSLKGKPVFKADKKHLHHRLLDMGLDQRQIVLFLYVVTAYLGIFSFLFVVIPEEYAVILLVLLALGFFMGIRIIGFIERKTRLIHMLKLERKRR